MKAIKEENMLKALSNPLRLEIVEIIARKPSTVNEIVSRTGSIQPKVSAHISVLADAGLVDSTQLGREKVYRICPEGFEDLVNWIVRLLHSEGGNAGDIKNVNERPSINDLNSARTCYDHLAGEAGVWFLEEMIRRRWIMVDDVRKPNYRLSDEGMSQLSSRGVRIPVRKNSKRMFAYGCLDWTVRRYHLGGALGASILKFLEESGYVERAKSSRRIFIKKDLKHFFDHS